ncbi:MAG TPA: hypothetical protein EYP14_09290 [Planctomycetaceae bacterium]|nr:hypothetical protein [Planctomycetaceae bacterium]
MRLLRRLATILMMLSLMSFPIALVGCNSGGTAGANGASESAAPSELGAPSEVAPEAGSTTGGGVEAPQ